MAEDLLPPRPHFLLDVTGARPSWIRTRCLQIWWVPALSSVAEALSRFHLAVPYDQWLLTHLHNDWIIKQVKHWILAKCNLAKPPDAPQRRSSSPIIFTPISAEDCLVGEDEEYPDETQHDWLNPDKLYGQSAVLCASPTDSPTAGGFLADRYTLISFSTGTILEDNQTISWYKLRPHELLEIHRSGTVVSLPREVAMNYVQPYFHARIKALLAVWSHKSGRFKPPGHSTEHEIGHKKRDRPTPPRWKPKLEWKDRWVVIHNDILSLAKDTAVCKFEALWTLCSMSLNRKLPLVTSFRWLPCKYCVALIRSDRRVQLLLTNGLFVSSSGPSSQRSRQIPLPHPRRLEVQKSGKQLRARRPLHRDLQKLLRNGSLRGLLESRITPMMSVVAKANGLCSICSMIMVSELTSDSCQYL